MVRKCKDTAVSTCRLFTHLCFHSWGGGLQKAKSEVVQGGRHGSRDEELPLGEREAGGGDLSNPSGTSTAGVSLGMGLGM